jgi:F0F1-type ATP synthase membrane subunit b/b'
MADKDPRTPQRSSPIDDFARQSSEEGTAEILYLLDHLEELVGTSKRVPFSTKIMVEEDEFLDLIEQLRISIPNEVKQAQRVVKDRERIIAEAQQEASRIVDTARSRAEYLISQDSITNESRVRAEDLLEQIEEKRKREIGEVEVYALEQFNLVEQALRDASEIMGRSIDDILLDLNSARDSIGQ